MGTGKSKLTQPRNVTECERKSDQLRFDYTESISYDDRNELILAGYLRCLLPNDQNDYNFIISMINTYYHQGYVQYFDVNTDKDYKQKMKLGDIIKRPDKYLYVVDIRGHQKYCGRMDYNAQSKQHINNIEIPYSICSRFDNAVEFYNFDKKGRNDDDSKYNLRLSVKHNDQWIINHFHGPLKHNYPGIIVHFLDNELLDVTINYSGTYEGVFNPQKRSITSKDIEDYFEIRKNPANLVKIRIIDKTYNRLKACEVYSNLWDVQVKYKSVYIDYIGPKFEKDKMIQKLKSIYSADMMQMIQISDVDYYSALYHNVYFFPVE